MKIEAYLTEVVSHIRSKEAKRFVQHELENHLQAVKADVLKRGRSEEEAELVAITQMGDSTLLGQKMNKLHRPKMDWLMLAGFVVLIGLSFLPLLYIQDLYGIDLVIRKAIYSIFGLLLVLGCMILDYRKLLKYGYWCFGIGIVLLIVLNGSPFVINGRPYIPIAGIGSVEASYALPLFLLTWASVLYKMENQSLLKVTLEIPSVKKGVTLVFNGWWKLCLLYTVSVLLLLPITNLFLVFLYTVLVVVMTSLSPVLKRDKYIFVGCISLFVLISTFASFMRQPHMATRLIAFLHPDEYANTYGYQVLKAKEFLGSAGWFGQALPKDGFVPEAHTDFIFVTLTYGYGWFLAGILVILLLGLSIKMVVNLKSMQDSFGRLLTIGAITLYSLSFSWSILMSFGIVPYVGVSFPFFSYGLMPTMLHSFLIGMVLSVYRRKDFVPLFIK